MKLRKLGWLLFLALASANSLGCRKDQPPQLSIICTLDGRGGGDCVLPGGQKIYKSPSEMKNFWATTQVDMSNFSAWCYDTSPENIEKAMSVILAEINSSREIRLAREQASLP